MRDNLLHSPLIFISIAFGLGIFLQQSLHLPIAAVSVAAILALLAVIIFSRSKHYLYLLSLLFLTFGALHFAFWQKDNLEHPIQKYLPLHDISISAIVEKPPAEGKKYFTVEGRYLEANGKRFSIRRKFLVKTENPISGLQPGDRVKFANVTLSALEPPRNPGQFNYSKYLAKRGVMGEITFHLNSGIARESSQSGINLSRILYKWREELAGRINQYLPDQTASFLAGVLLGKKEDISAEVKSSFQNTGVAHILAISGLHVGFVVLIIHVLISFFPVGFRWHYLLTIFFLLLYMLLTGAQPPVVRASIMVAVFLIGKILERKPGIYNTLFTAAFIILLINPQQLFWVGFQFSFIAVFSIVFFYQQLKPIASGIRARLPEGRLGKWLHNGLVLPFLVSFAAQLGTIPLMAIYFHKIPLISFFLNVLVIPVIGLVVAVGFLFLGISFISGALAFLTGDLLSQIIQFLILVVSQAARLPFAYIQLPRLPFISVVIYFLLLYLLFTRNRPQNASLKKIAIAFSVILFLWIFLPRSEATQLLMLDVGQGESTVLKTRSGSLVLFDTGPATPYYDTGEKVVFPAIQYLGRLHIDRVFISHPHADHIGGMFSLINLVGIDSVYLPDLQTHYFLQDSLLGLLQQKNIPVRFLRSGDRVRIDKLTSIYVLAPFNTFLKPKNNSGYAINNTSLVCLVNTEGQKILFTGDAEKAVERKLLSWGSFLDADVLKLGHHGSSTSSGISFLEKVTPRFGLIPVGLNNKYDHPSPVTIKALNSRGINFFRTDLSGAIWLEIKNGNWISRNWR